MNLTLALVLAAAVQTETSIAPEPDPRLGVFVATGFLAAGPGYGSALEAGVRLKAAKYLSASFDLGWGLLGSPRTAQDRWWLMPSLAVTFPIGQAQVDIGLGVGLGTTSGYASLATFMDAPFDPDWAFQLSPAARAHATVTYPLNSRTKLFARAEAATLVLGGNGIGFRSGNDAAPFGDITWLNFALGVQLGVL